MNIEIIIQKSSNNRTFDISQLASNISWSTDIANAQPGTLTFNFVEVDNLIPDYGDFIRFRFQSQNIFIGRIFTKTRSPDGIMKITAYDQMRFLKTVATYVFLGRTSSQIFDRICRDFSIRNRIVDTSTNILGRRVYNNDPLYKILNNALAETRENHNNQFIIRDNFGVLEHVHINTLQTTLVLGDRSMATGFNFQGSIDSDTYNRIRLTREEQEGRMRLTVTERDSANMQRWGHLEYHETVDEKLNRAQMTRRAQQLLRTKNRPTRTLSMTALGDARIQAGKGVVLNLTQLREEGFSTNQRAVVTGCTHNWTSKQHAMNLKLTMIRNTATST